MSLLRRSYSSTEYVIYTYTHRRQLNVYFKCKCKCRFIERDYVTPLMRYRLECPANRYVFKSRLNCSESTAGSLRQSGSEFQTVGPATEKARVPKVPRQTRGTNSWWRLADRRCWRPGTSEGEIQPFRACAMHPAIIIGTVHSLWTWLGADTTFHNTHF